MKLDRLIHQSFSTLILHGFHIEREKIALTIIYRIYKECFRIIVSIDFREDTIDFEIKRGTTVLLLIQAEDVMVNAPFRAFDRLMTIIHNEYAQIGNHGLTLTQLQRIMNAFVDFLVENWSVLGSS